MERSEATDHLSVGLTGGIGCGKTTVARMLEGRGCRMIDADKIGREMLVPGQESYDQVVERFGREILDEEGRIHRKKLATIIFADPGKRKALEQILHPRILREEQRLLDIHQAASKPGVSVVEAALMVEAGSWEKYDRLVVVIATPELQQTRLEIRGYTPEEARLRIQAQLPVEDKAALADYVVTNRGTREALQERIDRLEQLLREDLAAKSQGRPLPERKLEL